jgi:hypothetical protein
MTAPEPGELLHMAGTVSPDAILLLAIAEDDILDGPQLDDALVRHMPNVPQVERPWLYMELRDAVTRRRHREHGGGLPEGWTDEAIDGEILGHLFKAVHGVEACTRCLGPAITLDDLRPASEYHGYGVRTCRVCTARAAEALYEVAVVRPLRAGQVAS